MVGCKHIAVQRGPGCLVTAFKLAFLLFVGLPVATGVLLYLWVWLRT